MNLKTKIMIFTVMTLITLIILWFGITLPMITITLNTNVNAGIAQFNGEVINTTRSILGTAWDLYTKDKVLVGFLIFLFSVLLPIFKGFLFCFYVLKSKNSNKKINILLSVISKWSMADVFVVAILLVFLATDGQMSVVNKSLSLFGMNLEIKLSAIMKCKLEEGFYYFLTYCLSSIAVFQGWQLMTKKKS